MKFDVVNFADDDAWFVAEPSGIVGEARIYVGDPNMDEHVEVFMHWAEVRTLASYLNSLAQELRIDEEEAAEDAEVIPFPTQAINDYHNKEA